MEVRPSEWLLAWLCDFDELFADVFALEESEEGVGYVF
jgi:hypothetical protein